MRVSVAASCLPLLLLMMFMHQEVSGGKPSTTIEADKVNLALRRTADKLLRVSGDSTSRITPVEHTGKLTWRIQLHGSFHYDTLPYLLQASLEQYSINASYEVSVRQCENDIIALGFHQADFVQDSTVPCMGREEPQGCHYIEVTFSAGGAAPPFGSASGLLLLAPMLLGAGGAWWWLHRKKSAETAPVGEEDTSWIPFGLSRLHTSGQILESNGSRQSLTYREAKLLRLFADHPDQLLERDRILQQVWADEGVQVGRSIDMFVSRLRKKLQPDPTVGIVAVHGVGYRMEVKT